MKQPAHDDVKHERTETTKRTTDVVVLGAGPAGMAAVAAAADAGVEVVAVEALNQIGGNAVWSTGYLAFVSSLMQQDQGVVDDVETFVSDSRRMVELAGADFGVVWDEELVRLFARESAETYRDLVGRGVRFSRFIRRPRQHSVDRMAAVEDSWMFQRAYLPDFERREVTTLFATTVKRLLTDDAGRVAVVVVRRGDGTYEHIEARRGVVLATGGYQSNPLLRQRYQPEYLATGPYLGIDSCRGDGHLAGQALGGDLINMGFVPPLIMVSSSLVEDAIGVNASGKRFHDEPGPYEERVAHLLAQDGRRGWYLFDQVVASEKAELIAQMPADPITANSLPALAHALGMPARALEETVRTWNSFVDSDLDKDPETGRVVLPPGRRTLSTGPFTAVPMVVGVNFCSGGFRVTQSMQVVDVFGAPIPGLYAGGDCVGGLNAAADLGGIRISGGFTLGRVAGAAAATGTSSLHLRPSVQGAFLPSQLGSRVDLVHLEPDS